MKFDKNLAAIHGYLCGDGYVIKNPTSQKHKYYIIGFRNTNIILLKDFQEKFKAVFGIGPIITTLKDRCKVQNKEIYYYLTKHYSFYSYEWQLPILSKENMRYWLRAFFDCEGWVENQPRQSRLIGLDCCNEAGLVSVQRALKRFGIESQVKKRLNRAIWRLTICGFQNIQLYQRHVGFLHPSKRQKLSEALDSYLNRERKKALNRIPQA